MFPHDESGALPPVEKGRNSQMARQNLVLLLISVVTLACGGPDVSGSIPVDLVSEGSEAAETLTEREPLRQEPPAAAPPEDAGPFDLKLVGSGFTPQNGTQMHIAVALMGCGYWVVATGEEHVAQGAFTFQIDEGELPMGYGAWTLFFWSDNDADGACDVTAGDELWQLEVTDMESRVVPVAASGLTPTSGWECVLFDPIP